MKKSVLSVIAVCAVTFIGAALWVYSAPPAQVSAAYLGVERHLADLEPRTVEIPGFQVAYLEGGTGEPLLLLHGMGANKDEWNRVASHLTDRHRVIAVDLPGFGESDKPFDASYLTPAQVRYVQQFVEALNLDRLHLGGNSMGGRIAAAYAADYPERVESLWLLAPSGVMSAQQSELVKSLQRGKQVPMVVGNRAELDESLEWTTERPPYYPGPVKDAFAETAAQNYRLHSRIMAELRQETVEQSLEDIVTGLSVPTRIVWGEKDKLFHHSSARILEHLIDGSSVLLLPDTGHLPMIEAPGKLADDYRQFRAALEKS
ncbi:alpha/beta hydrolase [Halopseudomonas nanhaiensis]|uniref:alpha/beta fold hydrolase n=1 Tax=Halopseudomonas nanhaiensis TaxID=2830842 RepID=UPI001CBF8AA7|nr:alpha/beta hydrolase [Halopseudomonas nanhaiensis]UAW99619.1 alpha/beta hydrolase [Halopseudomonas nanhaiensis]